MRPALGMIDIYVFSNFKNLLCLKSPQHYCSIILGFFFNLQYHLNLKQNNTFGILHNKERKEKMNVVLPEAHLNN